MNVYKMRSALTDAYTGASWKDRVNHMTDDQVIAIYKRMERAGELYKHKRRTEPRQPDNTQPRLVTDDQGRKFLIYDRP